MRVSSAKTAAAGTVCRTGVKNASENESVDTRTSKGAAGPLRNATNMRNRIGLSEESGKNDVANV